MIALPYLSAICISGPDAGEFLHNQLSADVKGLAIGESTWACYCEPKGRVLALLLVASFDEGYYVILSSSLAQKVADRLKIFVMRSRVEIRTLSEVSVAGLEETEMAGAATKQIHAVGVPGSKRCFALAGPGAPMDNDAGLRGSWQYSELQRGICWLGELTSGQFLPQMLGFDKLGAVNFKKGCYPGQEIVARTHYLGKVKRHPRFLEISAGTPLEPMDKIHLQANGVSDEAVVVESLGDERLGHGVFVVSRLDPDAEVDRVELRSA